MAVRQAVIVLLAAGCASTVQVPEALNPGANQSLALSVERTSGPEVKYTFTRRVVPKRAQSAKLPAATLTSSNPTSVRTAEKSTTSSCWSPSRSKPSETPRTSNCSQLSPLVSGKRTSSKGVTVPCGSPPSVVPTYRTPVPVSSSCSSLAVASSDCRSRIVRTPSPAALRMRRTCV